jgi:hypothetical protein
MNNIKQLRICVEKTTEHKDITFMDEKKRAAYFKNNNWDNYSTINIYFMNKNPTIYKTPLSFFQKADEEGNIKMDPLQYEVNNDTNILDMIKRVVKERFEPIINLKFNFSDDPKSEIRINFDPSDGSWSYIGKYCLNVDINEPTMNFGWFDIPTVIHEFGHALGMIHEHQNTINDKGIDWNVPLLYKWAEETYHWPPEKVDSQIIYKYDNTLLNGSEFDPYSIMLYSYPKSVLNSGNGTRQNQRLSKYDTYYLNYNYPIKDNPNAAVEFYKNVYNEDLDPNNIKEMLTPAKIDNNNNENENFYKKYMIYIYLFGSIILFIIFYFIFKKFI